MSLREINIESVYSSDEYSIMQDFYIPCLKVASNYDRAVGYFSSASLSLAAEGIGGLVANGGKMRLVIGCPLDLEDYEATKSAERVKEILGQIEIQIGQELDSVIDNLSKNRFEMLSWLVSSGRLEIRLALRPIGMYHEKMGIIYDKSDKIVFSGSANETRFGLMPEYNLESITVYKSWDAQIFKAYGEHFIRKFEQLWDNKVKNTLVVKCPSQIYEKFSKITEKKGKPDPEKELLIIQQEIDKIVSNTPKLPDVLNGERYSLKNHQILALEAWRAHNYIGIFALATGAGKTVMAIHAAVKIFEAHKRLFLIIAVPYQNLADQWSDNLAAFGIKPLMCYQSQSQWREELFHAVQSFVMGSSSFEAVVVVNKTLCSDEFKKIISDLNKPEKYTTMFVGDECHHHDSKATLSQLPNFHFRMGLSATPFNDENRTFLKEYYGQIVSTYSIGDALEDKVLTPYYYQIIPVELTNDEAEKYEDASAKIAQMLATMDGEPDFSNPILTALLAKRARLLGSAENKLIELKNHLKETATTVKHTIFYCGDGYIDVDDEGDSRIKQINLVSKLLSTANWKTTRFTAEESLSERRAILEQFRGGLIDALVAIKVLDEGIDVPACKQAYLLASSRNPRQFIQRRGRILRKSSGKEFAIIYDFAITPPPNWQKTLTMIELIKKEVERISEFAKYCINPLDSIAVAEKLYSKYGVNKADILGDDND